MTQPFLNSASEDVEPGYKTSGSSDEDTGDTKVTYSRVVNTLTVLYAAEGAALKGYQTHTEASLVPITLDEGFDTLEVEPCAPKAVNAGGYPADCIAELIAGVQKNATGQFVITPQWVLHSLALNTAIAAIAAGTLECWLKITQRKL